MDGLYKVVEVAPAGFDHKPKIVYDFKNDFIDIDGIKFTAEFFFFLTQGLNDGDLFEITRRNGAISLRKVILQKP